MKSIRMLLIILAIAMSSAMSQTRVLVYTKNETGEGKYIHDNIAASVEALQKICAAHNIATQVSDDPALFTPENLARYDAIVFSNTNNGRE